LKKGDVILEVNGERVESPEDLLNEVNRSKDTLQFRIAPGFSKKNTIQTQQVPKLNNGSNLFLLTTY